ncbi:MAG: hypothetical protein FWF63_01575 [Fibromonadales bacterium]|nr:hypothetical protein [Fibromonadales bacterium]
MKTSYKSLAFIFLLIIFISDANAKYNKEQNNQKISIYGHPASLYMAYVVKNINIVDTGDGSPDEDQSPIYTAYLTVEIPLSLRYSLIIQPSLWYVEGGWYSADNEILYVDKLFRLGSGIGLRHFVNGKGDGLYLQPMSSVHYYSIKESYNDKDFYYKKGYYADLLGYLGYSWKYSFFSIFSDIGIGTIFPFGNSSYKVLVGGYNKPFTFDMNLGIGFSF